MAKHPVSQKEEKKEKAEWTMTCWDSKQQKNVQMNVEQAIRESLESYGPVDWKISENNYEENKESVLHGFKVNGYVPSRTDSKGKPKSSFGYYHFHKA